MLEAKVTEILTKLEGVAAQLGQSTVDAVLSAVQYQSVGGLVLGVVLGVTALSGVAVSRYFYKRELEETEKKTSTGGYWAASMAVGATAALAGVGSLVDLFSVWNWVGTFDPAARLAATVVL